MALSQKQNQFVQTFVVGVFAGVVTNIAMHFFTKVPPAHPEKPDIPPKEFIGGCPPPGA